MPPNQALQTDKMSRPLQSQGSRQLAAAELIVRRHGAGSNGEGNVSIRLEVAVLNRFEILIKDAADGVDNRKPPRPIDYAGFLEEFRRFNWLNETNRYFWTRRFSPEILVRNADANMGLSVTSNDVLGATLDYREPTLEGMIDFVLIPRNGVEAGTADAPRLGFTTPRKREVEMAYRLFFAGSYEALDRHLSSLLPADLIEEST